MTDEIFEDENGLLTDEDGYLVNEAGELLETDEGEFIHGDEFYAWQEKQEAEEAQHWQNELADELQAVQAKIGRNLSSAEFDRLVKKANETGQGPLQAIEADASLVNDINTDDGRLGYMSELMSGGDAVGEIAPVNEDE